MLTTLASSHVKNLTTAFFLGLVFVTAALFVEPPQVAAQTTDDEETTQDDSDDVVIPSREELWAEIARLQQVLQLLLLQLDLMEQLEALGGTATTTPAVTEDTGTDTFFCTLSAPATAEYGDTVTISWDSVGADYAQFVLARSGADGFGLPEGRQRGEGSTNVVANSYGAVAVKLAVFGSEGRAECNAVVNVAEPETEDVNGATIYSDGGEVLILEHVTKRYTISYCQAYAAQRPTKTTRCVWGDDEVYYYAPSTTPQGQTTSCSVTLIPSVVKVGETYTVSVSSFNSSYTTLSGIGASYTRGNAFDSRQVTATEAGTFKYNGKAIRTDATGATLYSATCSGVVIVQEAEQTADAPFCRVEAIPYQTETGRKYTIKWDSTNATHVTIDGKRYDADGFTSFSKSSAGTYTHTVKAVGEGGTGQCAATVTIIALPQTYEEAASVSKSSVSDERVTVSYANIPFYSYVALYNEDDGKRYDVSDAYIGGTGSATLYLNSNRPSGDYYVRVTREAPPANDSLYNEIAKSSSFSITSGTNSSPVTCSLAESDDETLRWSSAGADYAVVSWKVPPQQYHAFHTEIGAEGEMSVPATVSGTEYLFVFYNYQNKFATCTHKIN